MWPDEPESLEDDAARDPPSGGDGGGGSASADEEGHASLASKSKLPQVEAGSGEGWTAGADGGLRDEWEQMTTDEKV